VAMAEEKQESSKNESNSGGSNKLLLIITLLNFLISIGVISIIFLNFKSKKEQQISDIAIESEEEVESASDQGKDSKNTAKNKNRDFGKYIKLEEFMVNLNTVGSVRPQFFKVNIELLVQNADIEEESKQKMPQIRNAIIDLINSKKSTDLATVEGRDHLKEEIKNALNTFLVTGKVSEVFFTNYVL